MKLSIRSLFQGYKSLCYITGRLTLINGIKKFKRLPSGDVLDIGCGKKPYKSYFTGNIRKYIGMDLAYSQEVDIIGDAVYLPLLNQSFDTLLCFNALNVFRNPFTFFREANRVLKSNGYLIVTTGFMYPIWSEFDRWRTTKLGLRTLAEDNGFAVDNIVALGEGFWTTSVIFFRQHIFYMLENGIKVMLKRSAENLLERLKGFISAVIVLPFTPLLPIIINILFIIARILDNIFPDYRYCIYYLLIARKNDFSGK